MSDSKSRGGKNLMRKLENTIIVTLKKNLKVTLFTTFFLRLISSWFLPYFSFPASSFLKCPVGSTSTVLWGVFWAVPSFSQYKHTFFLSLSHSGHVAAGALWVQTWAVLGAQGLCGQQLLPNGDGGVRWALLHSHQYLHLCAWPSF